MDEEIKNFIQKQKIATICCVDERGNPYCFTCFYAFDPIHFLLIFKSATSSYHSKLLTKKGEVSGTILPEKTGIFPITGIQFSGTLLHQADPHFFNTSQTYHKKFPIALTVTGEIFALRLEAVKMTNSRNILGKKIIWQREPCEAEK